MRYLVNTDGGSRGNPGAAGYGYVVRAEDGRILLRKAGYLGTATNNVAEYSAVVDALEAIAAADPDAHVTVRADSRLVVEQMSGRWKIKHPEMQALAMRARKALGPAQVRYEWVPRAENKDADELANRAMDRRLDWAHGSLPGGAGAAAGRGDGTEPEDAGEPHDDVVHAAGAPTEPDVTEYPPVTRRQSGAAWTFEADPPVTLVLVRHGETAMTAAAGFSGGSEPGPPLSATGRRQAAMVAGALARMTSVWPDLPAPTLLWASPMVRTRETADLIGNELGLPTEVVEDLREIDFGRWQGMRAHEITDQFPGGLHRWAAATGVAPEGGETIDQVEDRMLRVARQALKSHAGQTVVLVTHSIASKVALWSLAGRPNTAWHHVRTPPGSFSVMRLWPSGAHEVVVTGVTPELLAPEEPALLF